MVRVAVSPGTGGRTLPCGPLAAAVEEAERRELIAARGRAGGGAEPEGGDLVRLLLPSLGPRSGPTLRAGRWCRSPRGRRERWPGKGSPWGSRQSAGLGQQRHTIKSGHRHIWTHSVRPWVADTWTEKCTYTDTDPCGAHTVTDTLLHIQQTNLDMQ